MKNVEQIRKGETTASMLTTGNENLINYIAKFYCK